MEKKNHTVFKVIKNIISFIMLLVFAAFILVVCLQRFSNNEISIMGYRMFTVVTGSMKPKYNVGDVLVIKTTNPNQIKIGDDISYLGEVSSFKDKIVTHRVIGIESSKTGERIFRVRGIANLVEDPVITGDQIFGVVKYKTYVLSMITKIIATKEGMFLFIIIPIGYMIISEVIAMLLSKEAKRRNSGI